MTARISFNGQTMPGFTDRWQAPRLRPVVRHLRAPWPGLRFSLLFANALGAPIRSWHLLAQ
jgi:hypothetical protein